MVALSAVVLGAGENPEPQIKTKLIDQLGSDYDLVIIIINRNFNSV